MRLEALNPGSAMLTDSLAPHWRKPLLHLALAWLGLLVLFAPDWAAMAWQWWDSSTYNHILLVPPILGWLVWQRAPELAQLSPRAWWPGLVLLAGALLIWLLGDISGTATASHLGAVAMLQAVTISLLGPRVSWALLFPLAYGFFLVPFGDELVPALQMITAAITIWLTLASGIPAVIEGVFIDTPVGLFEVAEACSGVKFLVAMVALGTLVANVCFRSWWRRAAFMALAVILPIFANGIRAWGTIFIAQSQGLEFAAGFDHIFYGWIFFGLVMAAVLAVSWRFFDRGVEEPFIDPEAILRSPALERLERISAKPHIVGASIAALALLTLAWASNARQIEAELPQHIALPTVSAWQQVAADQRYDWQPLAGGAAHRLQGTYRNAAGQNVDVVFALYSAQREGSEAGAYGQGALIPNTEWRWLSDEAAIAGAHGERLQALGSIQRVAMTYYRRADWLGASRARLKLLSMRDKLLLQAQPTAMLILSAEETGEHSARETISDFLASTGDLDLWMDQIAAGD